MPPGLIYFVALLAGDVEQTRKKEGERAGKQRSIQMRITYISAVVLP